MTRGRLPYARRVLLELALVGTVWPSGAIRSADTTAPKAAPAEAAPSPERLADWVNGPVRYVLSRRELQEFEKLDNDQARALFIVRFWRRWDPTPTTLENESRREYWSRVLEANRLFRDSVRPGWLTDRGRIFILLGRPDTEEKDERGGIGSLPGRGSLSAPLSSDPTQSSRSSPLGGTTTGVDNESAERGLLRWTYRRLPGNKVEPELVFAFTRDESGEWRLSNNPRYYGAVFPGVTAGEIGSTEAAALSGGAGKTNFPQAPGQDSIVVSNVFSAIEKVQQIHALSEIGRASLLALDRAEATRLPAPGEELGEFVTSSQFLGKLPLQQRFAFFRAADGSTVVRVGASVEPKVLYSDPAIAADLSSFLLLYARFSPRDAPAPAPVSPPPGAPAAGAEPVALYASNEASPVPVSARDATADAPLEAWAQRALAPGRYEVGIGIEDAATGQLTSVREDLEVPSFGPAGLSLSSLMPVHSLQESPEGVTPAPRVDTAFRRSEDFGVYIEVYGLAAGEPFSLTSRFFVMENGAPRPIGKPIVRDGLTNPAQGWTVPLQKWPPGPWRLEMTAAQGASTASATLDFTVR